MNRVTLAAVSWMGRAGAICLLPFLIQLFTVRTADAGALSFGAAMQGAAQARQVPLPLIEATTYVNTRWEWINTPSHDGGVGPMNVRPSQITLAASLSGHSPSQIAGDLAANLDAGAALLAHDHSSGKDLASWRPAVVSTQGPIVANQIYDALATGATRITSTGETISLDPQALVTTSPSGAAAPAGAAGVSGAPSAATSSTDYPSATWYPADPSNYSVADRPHDYPVDMIIIHDIEGSYGSAIQDFQRPGYAASANYVVGYQGQIAQMVLEKDIAWHAGNWDYNTRAIGIEHEGFAAYNLYTTAEYNASAALAASICSRWGVPMDRNHVIGHYQVPDPNNPGLFGGSEHHTDPGPYWNWTYYMATAQADATKLSSPPHLMPDPTAVSGLNSVTVSWQPARTCHTPISGYTVTGQPGNLSMALPATATTATFNGLQQGTAYTFTVTAQNSDGQDSLTTNPAIPGSCTSAGLTVNPSSPQVIGTAVTFTATSTVCPNPRYQFWILPPAGAWTVVQPYSASSSYNWTTTGAFGSYSFAVWARDASSPGTSSSSAGTFDARTSTQYTLNAPPCTAMNAVAAPPSPEMAGAQVTITAAASGCSSPTYEFWLLPPSGGWSLVQPYSPSPTFTWKTSGRAAGSYRFSVWARNVGSAGTGGTSPDTYDAFSAFQYILTTGCPAMTGTASPASTAMTGTTVTISASASGCPNPQYEVWLLPPGGTWTLAKPYSSTATLRWSTGGQPVGSYRISIWARDATSSSSYDAFSAFQYALTAAPPCSAMGASASPPTSANVSTTVTVTGSATGCPNPRYEFWLLPPGGAWTLAQAYSASATFTWSTAGRPAGSYRFSAWARDAGSNASYDAFSAFNYTLTVTPCTGVTVTTNPSGTAQAGNPVTVTAAATGCPNALYEFWLLPPGGGWTLMRGYTANGTLAWSTVSRIPGTYRFSVWARDASSSASYDAFDAFDYKLT